jgi:DegV family protein with EDD domain
MSSTFQNANLAKKEVAPDKIYIVDSKNLSSCIGLLLLKASKDIKNGLSAKEVAQNMEENTKLVLSQFVIEKMDYLYKGGRCSGVAKFVGTLLKIKPYIIVRDGKMSVGKKPIGKMQVALNALLKQIEEDKDRVDLDHILITHSIAYEYRDYLYERLRVMFPNVDIISTVAGCVISSHCGRGTIGILYMLKKE